MVSAVRVEQVASVLEFTLDDLARNRVGKLSSHQVWMVTKWALVQGGIALLLLFGVAAMIFGAGLTGFRRVAFYSLGFLSLAIYLPSAGLFVVAAVARRVDVHEGTLDLHGTGRGSVAVVDSHRVIISWEAAKVLKSGECYRIYGLGYSNEFLSIEPVSPVPASGEEDR